MTDDPDMIAIAPKDHTFAESEDFDRICDSCDAKGHAVGCIRCISVDMQKHRETVRKNKVEYPIVFLEAKLKEIRIYWIKYFTKLVESASDSYWRKIFNQYVNDETKDLVELKKEDTKKEKLSY